MRVLVVNGPNLNLLGSREPEVYGSATMSELEAQILAWGEGLGIVTTFHQSNHEGGVVEAIHGAVGADGIIINPGALTHTSRSIGDAIVSVGVPTVEVHISNVKRREPWRAVSLVSEACVRTIYGRGTGGYQAALRHLRNRAAIDFETIRYGPHRENVGDLRMPTGNAAGLVFLIHGGFWRDEYERDTTETMAVDLTEGGYATWNIEYRRVGGGGGWPGSAHDVLTAIDLTRQHEGMSHLPLAVLGHSAGGHLGLWAVSRRPDSVALTIGLAAVTDLSETALSGEVGARDAHLLLDSGAPSRLDAVPARALLIHGEDDVIVPVSHSTRLDSVANVEVMPGMGHFDLLDAEGEHWPLVVTALKAALT
ncbi:MAG: type II 3-dehydroquinate dehydratase [Actinomycetota bacterium]|nr:type II 3-dehydroquinate dehydratase [Actinomycetota bacterium]